MIYAQRRPLVAVCVFFGLSVSHSSVIGQQPATSDGPPKPAVVQLPPGIGVIGPPPPGENAGEFSSSVNCRAQNFQFQYPKNGIQPFDPQSTQTLNYVVVKTWFSTEPLVLPQSDFVVSGLALRRAYTRNGIVSKACTVVLPKSDPSVISTTCPASSKNNGCIEIKDQFCTYDKAVDLVPYYASTAGSSPHNVSQTRESSPITPPACAGYEAISTAGLQRLDTSQVPLSYSFFQHKSWVYKLMVPIRPFIQPNVTSITFGDQVGINSLPRWSIIASANPVLYSFFGHADENTRTLNYLSLNLNVNLNNQFNQNPNSTVGSLEWNMRSRGSLTQKWLRRPELNTTFSGVEYDFVSNDVNVYYPGAGLNFPLAVLNSGAQPAVFVWRLQLGEVAGWHVRNPSFDLAGTHSVNAALQNEGNELFRGVAGMTMNLAGWNWLNGLNFNSTYQAMLPATDEPFTVPSSSSSKPPNVTLTDKVRNYVKSSISERLGKSNFSMSITYQYGSLPPAFWLIKNSLSLNLTLASTTSRTE